MNKTELRRRNRARHKIEKRNYIQDNATFIRNACLEQGVEAGYKVEGSMVKVAKDKANNIRKGILNTAMVIEPEQYIVTRTPRDKMITPQSHKREGESLVHFRDRVVAKAMPKQSYKGAKAHKAVAAKFTAFDIAATQGVKTAQQFFGNGDKWQGLINLWETRASVINFWLDRQDNGDQETKYHAAQALRRIRIRDTRVLADRGVKSTEAERIEHKALKEKQLSRVYVDVNKIYNVNHDLKAHDKEFRTGHEKKSKWGQWHKCNVTVSGRGITKRFTETKSAFQPPVLPPNAAKTVNLGDMRWQYQSSIKQQRVACMAGNYVAENFPALGLHIAGLLYKDKKIPEASL